MDDELPFASHITRRGRVFQYVRRVPDDISDVVPLARIQRSLRTTDKAVAYAAAAAIHREIEQQFATLRRKRGVTLNIVPVDDWLWPDWESLANWLKATLLEEDWLIRLRVLPGGAFDNGVPTNLFWRDAVTARSHIDLLTRLRTMTVETYAQERFGYVQAAIRPVGVPLSRSMAYFDRFMGACMKAEIEYLNTFLDREGGKLQAHPHPDTISGKWREASQRISDQQVSRILGTNPVTVQRTGKTLSDCLEQWKGDRKRANKKITKHGLNEKEAAIEEFQKHAKIRDIGEISRANIIAYRDHLSKTMLATATFNKKVGHITTLVTTAKKAGWVDHDFSGGIYIEIPAGTNEREPFDLSELDIIFSHSVFIKNEFSTNPKSAENIQFWLPLISITSGLISSEIMQLGPETVGPHPSHPEIICFYVSNAGGRSLKAHTRQRYVPIRQELLKGGLLNVVAEARENNRKYIWKSIELRNNIDLSSNMFSAYWSDHLRNSLLIADEKKSIYSFRHNFRDGLSAVGATNYEKDQLMGHSEAGTGAKYGTRKAPRVVDIDRLNSLIQKIRWPFLANTMWPGE